MKFKISEVEKLIEDIKKDNLKFSYHAKERINDRNLTFGEIEDCILNSIIYGIIYQEENRYKLILKFDDIFDLYLIVRFLYDKNLKIITVYINFIDKKVRS